MSLYTLPASHVCCSLCSADGHTERVPIIPDDDVMAEALKVFREAKQARQNNVPYDSDAWFASPRGVYVTTLVDAVAKLVDEQNQKYREEVGSGPIEWRAMIGGGDGGDRLYIYYAYIGKNIRNVPQRK
jgi:hypothetical protein